VNWYEERVVETGTEWQFFQDREERVTVVSVLQTRALVLRVLSPEIINLNRNCFAIPGLNKTNPSFI
jgi:hypothetical protein